MYDKFVKELEANMSRVTEIDAETVLTEELKAEQEGLIAAQPALKAKIERAAEQVEMGNFLDNAKSNPPIEQRVTKAVAVASAAPMLVDATRIPANVRRYGGGMQAFENTPAGELNAYKFGQWFRAINGSASATDYCNQVGILLATHQEGDNTTGGYLVPTEFDNEIVRLVLEYGVARRNMRNVPMSSDAKTKPRRTGGLTAHFVGESVAGTESTTAWDQIQWIAKKLMVLTKMSSELNEDEVIGLGDELMMEISLAFATKEDQCGFNGDGTSTYGGITGALVALKAAAGTPTTTSAGGIIVSANNTYGEITLKECHNVIGLCPTYARSGAKWYASPLFNDTVFQSLQTAAGGNTTANIAAGGGPSFLGYPVELSEVFPTAAANSQVSCLFGDLRQAAGFGDRRKTTISTSDSAYVGGVSVFETDEIAIKGTERFDINVHDVGDTSTAGPIVGLQLLNA